MNIVITGADGQLGRAFRLVLPDATYLTHHELDLSWEHAKIVKTVDGLQPNVFINCAAYTAVDQAETEPELAEQINHLAVQAIAEGCQQAGARLIQISTDYVLSDDHPHSEEEKPNPQSVYGATKLGGEMATLRFNGNTVVRTSWVFGEGNNFVRTMLKLSETMPEISVVSDQVGRPTYALDLARSIAQLIELPDRPALVHIQNSGPIISWADFAEMIFSQAAINTKVRRISTTEYTASRGDKPTAQRPTNSAFTMELAEKLSIKPRDFTLALREYLNP